MKKFFALLAVVLAVVSCQKDVDVDVNLGGDLATISVVLPEDAITRAAAKDTNSAWSGLQNEDNESLTVTLYIFDENGNPSKEPLTATLAEDNLVANFDVRLVPGRDYTFVAWAGQVGAEDNFTIKTPTNPTNSEWIIALNDWAAMDESRDAFTGILPVQQFSSTKSIPTLELTRPFAKLRVVTTDMEWINNINVTPAYATVTYEVALPETFNAFTETIGTDVFDKKIHSKFEIKDYTKDATDATGEMTLFTDYILVPASGIVKFTLDVFEDKDCTKLIKTTPFVTDIPVKRNNLTTIKGNVLTDGNNITVEVKPDFANGTEWNPEDDKYDVEVWDGKTTKMPKHNGTNPDDISDATKVYVEKGSELAWLADLVNGGTTRAAGNSLKGKTIILNENINLNNEPWTPIGSEGAPFCGTFDGNGKTIANLVVNGYDSNAGLFGFTTDGEIKNLVIDNAKVSGRLNVGVVAGTPYTSKYTNITIKGHVEVNGMAYVGGVGGKNAYANWENITVEVDKTSYVKAHSIENGTAYRTYVGGVVGFNGEGGHSFKNITSNIHVQGSTCDVGGLFGIAHYGNKFENLTCTGDVEIYAATEADEVDEIGGIAGVWNNGGAAVEMKNIKFEGEIETNIERANVWYGGLVGKYYSEDGAGKLIINGLEFDKSGANFKVVNEILAQGEGFVFPFDMTGNKAGSNGNGGTGIDHRKGGVIDGNGFTLKVNNAGGTWDSALHTKGGTIKNLTIAKGFRGIFITNGSEKVVLENVTIAGPTYTISCDSAGNQGIEAYESTFNGWTSYAGTIGEAYFEDCSFGYGAGYKFARPYAPTTFVNCDFCEGYQMDPRAKVTFINCRVNGVDLTPANYDILVTSNKANAEFKTEDGHPIVGDAAGIKAQVAKENAIVYVQPREDGTAIDIESKLSLAKGVKLIGVGEEPVKIVNSWSSNAFANQAHFTDTYVENINFTNNLVIDAGIVAGDVKFVNCVFGGNLAHQGVHFDSGNGTLTFDNCTFVGRNMLGSSIEKVTFNKCYFENKRSSQTGADKWTGVNMWGKYEFNECVFGTEAHCGVKCDGVVAAFNKCSFTDNRDVTSIVSNSNNFTADIKFDGNKYVAEGLLENENGDKVAYSEAGLKAALENGGTVVLANPFTIDQSESNGYGKTGINMTNGGTLDGNGNELGAPGSTGTWDSAINTSGGTIKNIKVTKGFRGIFIKKDANHNEKLYLNNVTIDGTTYTISCDSGNDYGLEATNSTFKGWTSYAATLGNAKFIDCYFGEGNGNSYCRPYAPTEFVGCEFEAGLTLDPRADVTFEDCTLGGVALTAENLDTLVTNPAKATIK